MASGLEDRVLRVFEEELPVWNYDNLYVVVCEGFLFHWDADHDEWYLLVPGPRPDQSSLTVMMQSIFEVPVYSRRDIPRAVEHWYQNFWPHFATPMSDTEVA